MNAIKHGLTAQTLVLPNEDPAEYREMLHSYLEHFQPNGQIELDLLHEMVAAKWRQGRLWAVETEFLAERMSEQKQSYDDEYPDQEIARLTLAFRALANTPLFPSIHRIEARLERAYSRALRNLLQLQASRKSSAVPATVSASAKQICKNEPKPMPRTAPTPSPIPAAALPQPAANRESQETMLHFTAAHNPAACPDP